MRPPDKGKPRPVEPRRGPEQSIDPANSSTTPRGSLAIDRLLSRLDLVKVVGPGRWIARCPAHQDRSPSLSIRETDDGRILIHDFGGCAALDVVQAVGLHLHDLFAEPLRGPERHRRPPIPGWQRRQLEDALEIEGVVVAIGHADLAEGKVQSPADRERLALAERRVGKLRRMLG